MSMQDGVHSRQLCYKGFVAVLFSVLSPNHLYQMFIYVSVSLLKIGLLMGNKQEQVQRLLRQTSALINNAGIVKRYSLLCPTIRACSTLNQLNIKSSNMPFVNLLSYPWIEERVRNGLLSIHGGYYDFINCTFEKWTLDYKGNSVEEDGKYTIKDRVFWS